MSTISVTNINDGDAVTAASINNQVNTIVNDYNGNITAANLAANAVTDAKITANNLLATKISNLYKFSVYRNAALTYGSPAVVPFDTKVFDTGSNVDIITNKGRFTAPVAGFYWFAAACGFNANGSGFQLSLQKNGSTASPSFQGGGSIQTGAWGNVMSTSGMLQLAVNDYVEVLFYGSGQAASVGTAPIVTWFQGFLLSSI